MPKDYRYNPFDDVVEPVQCVETHIIPMNSPYVVRLNEVPVKVSPSTITMTIAGVTATEVAAAPASGEFRPDYSTGANDDSEWNTGLIQFNAADAGKIIVATYNGLGTLASVKAPSYPAWFTDRGDGSDGDYAPTANETLSAGLYNFKSVYIPAGVTITCSVCTIIKCQGAFVCAGNIVITPCGGAGGTGTAGAAGGAGNSGNGFAGGAGHKDVFNNNAGGAGGNPFSYGFDLSAISRLLKNETLGGAGGGAGGSDGTNAGTSGGQGGGSIKIVAGSISVTGSINANGANGVGATTNGPGCGGAGGGGAIVLIADTLYLTGTITANGGIGGVNTKNSSLNGAAGSNGIVFLKELGAA
ncbi:MAG: hypothetical protein GXX11_00895 [Acholeplasmataceae bacterium]|nr:hypothetical protein [Acholeplasmataceae bacterium]